MFEQYIGLHCVHFKGTNTGMFKEAKTSKNRVEVMDTLVSVYLSTNPCACVSAQPTALLTAS